MVMITIDGLKEITERMDEAPAQLEEGTKITMNASMAVLHENIPPYPNVPNPTRTGTLGRTLGSSMDGGAMGQPQIYEVTPLGGANIQGRFGTNLDYAPYVIGEAQAWMHYRWWMLRDVAKAAEGKIAELWNQLLEKLAAFLDG